MYSASNIPNTESEYGQKLNSITTDDTWTYQNGNWTCTLIYTGNTAFLALAICRESCIWPLSNNKPSGWYLCNQPMKAIFQGAKGYSSWYKCTTVRGTSDYNIYICTLLLRYNPPRHFDGSDHPVPLHRKGTIVFPTPSDPRRLPRRTPTPKVWCVLRTYSSTSLHTETHNEPTIG